MTTKKVILISALTSLSVAAILGLGFIAYAIIGSRSNGNPNLPDVMNSDNQIKPNEPIK